MYSVFRVDDERRVPLLERHARRLGVGAGVLSAFAREAGPGVYRATFDSAALKTERRPASRLVEGMPTRVVVSPYAERVGRFAKPAPPNRYDEVRVAGVATLLSSADGRALYESCSASLLAWDGGLVLVSAEAPGVASLAEDAVADALPHRRGVLSTAGVAPLLLINAVAGTCAISVPGRGVFPADVRARVQQVLTSER